VLLAAYLAFRKTDRQISALAWLVIGGIGYELLVWDWMSDFGQLASCAALVARLYSSLSSATCMRTTTTKPSANGRSRQHVLDESMAMT
jgi:hypothetical protein